MPSLTRSKICVGSPHDVDAPLIRHPNITGCGGMIRNTLGQWLCGFSKNLGIDLLMLLSFWALSLVFKWVGTKDIKRFGLNLIQGWLWTSSASLLLDIIF
ncbi:hypothetical protein VNO78_08763 [Psophocarpus tetragonolobus]|uniref:Uncharacterized protein n=1 Tax=Psophocarpus tetragonolobus TaxID=3891 RepID=A0AAN9SVD6_PSOTE